MTRIYGKLQPKHGWDSVGLGSLPDTDLAKQLGVRVSTVADHRRLRGIPAAKGPGCRRHPRAKGNRCPGCKTIHPDKSRACKECQTPWCECGQPKVTTGEGLFAKHCNQCAPAGLSNTAAQVLSELRIAGWLTYAELEERLTIPGRHIRGAIAELMAASLLQRMELEPDASDYPVGQGAYAFALGKRVST